MRGGLAPAKMRCCADSGKRSASMVETLEITETQAALVQ